MPVVMASVMPFARVCRHLVHVHCELCARLGTLRVDHTLAEQDAEPQWSEVHVPHAVADGPDADDFAAQRFADEHLRAAPLIATVYLCCGGIYLPHQLQLLQESLSSP